MMAAMVVAVGGFREADQAPAAPASGDAGAFLETAFDQARRVGVPVYLNGRGPFEFVVDTGSNVSVVSTEVAQICQLPEAGQTVVHGILSAEPTTLVQVSRLRVGKVVSAGLRLPRVPRSRVGADGILGLDMLHGRRIVLNFQSQTFEISPSDPGAQIGVGVNSRLAAPGQPVTVAARFHSGQLVIIDAQAAGEPITAFLDSGSQVTVANRAMKTAALARRPDLAARLIHSELMSATGQRAPAEFGVLPGLRLGGLAIEAPLVAFADLHIFDLWDLQARPTVLIGVDTLRRFDRVAFDFSRKLITFWPLRTRASRPFG
jgi:hypothetical protein